MTRFGSTSGRPARRGFQYQFEANADGAHNESSTENVAFSPHWESHGTISATAATRLRWRFRST